MSIEQAVSMDASQQQQQQDQQDNNSNSDGNIDSSNSGSTTTTTASTAASTSTSTSDSGKDYSFYQSHIQSKFAQFQGERINEIAKLARKDKHEILLFKNHNINTNPDEIPDDDIAITDPNMSQEQYINSVCDRQTFRIKQVSKLYPCETR